ncbi:ferritin-like domain-containing protein [Sorangium sp. So ce1000]|uniref:ferritin-like domain-containing protein n=1 Tax=Sorangium sp. So ce1000 TaxID=3133325 RepID=UPI003F5E7CA9
MRTRLKRHLSRFLVSPETARAEWLAALSFALGAKGAAPSELAVPPEFNARDYTIMLLQIGAQIEHALMVQYLYAAYSLGGPQIPDEHQGRVRGWQEVILGIAKEEMGHLISVQNVLRLLGGPLDLDREDFPFSNEFYPFPFRLEPLTLDALAKYIYAEMPVSWSGELADEIRERALQAAGSGDELHRVGALYATMIELIGLPSAPERRPYLPDADFDASTYPFQASWDEWGRGYQGGARGQDFNQETEAALDGTPDVLVKPLASRDDAVAALQAIAEQGEAPETSDDDAYPSHFKRFLTIYEEFKATGAGERWIPTRKVPINPTTAKDLDDDSGPSASAPACTLITDPEAVLWAHLFNLRYRMLLVDVAHAFTLAGALTHEGELTARGTVINATFGEMHNLRSIADILVRTPLSEKGDMVAGPTFEMPYTLVLPEGEPNRWRLHRDLLEASAALVLQLQRITSPEHQNYLTALKAADERAFRSVEAMLEQSRGEARARRS